MNDRERPSRNLFHHAIYLTGATASGKTAVGVALAKRLGAEVLALDSMTVYRGMDVGTAKPTLDERAGVPHHLIDVIDPWDAAGVGLYRGWAAAVLEDLARRGVPALFVGGTPLYLKACLRGLFEGPAAEPRTRRALEEEAERLGDAVLHARLATLDPPAAARLHVNDRRRIIRALEVHGLTGRPISEAQIEHAAPAPPSVPVFALERPRPLMVDRINRRVVAMFESGLVEEVRALRSLPIPWNPVPAQGVGYLEVAAMLDGRLTTALAIERTQARTRQFAKRQGTWFRGLEEVAPWPVPDDEPAEVTAEKLAEAIERRRNEAIPT